MSEQKPQTIVQLQAQNFANLKAVCINPDGNVVLTGKNEAGKSNVLNLIQAVLEGLKVPQPIRDGEDRAEATMDLGDLQIKKKWTPKGESLEVFNVMADGKKQKYSSPQTFLNELTGKMVDPMKLFHMMKDNPKKFRDTLADLVGLNTEDLDREESEIRASRREITVEIKGVVAQLSNAEPPNPDTPSEEITFKDSLDKMNRLLEKKEARTAFENQSSELKNCINRLGSDIEKYQQQIIEIQGKIGEASTYIQKYNEELEALEVVDLVLPDEIISAEAELEELENKNVEIRKAARYRSLIKESDSLRAKHDKFTQKIERVMLDKQTRIAALPFPVEGLSITDEDVIYNGKPIAMASSGRQIRIFTSMAMAMSPNIRVLLIRDGSLLDKEAFKEVCDIANEEGYQIWLEKVEESGKVGVFIEDGEVKSIDGEEV